MENLDQYIAPELREAVRRFGFNKVAARMYGVEEINEKTAATIIGEKMMTRLAEWRQVSTGLSSLSELEKVSRSFSENLSKHLGHAASKLPDQLEALDKFHEREEKKKKAKGHKE